MPECRYCSASTPDDQAVVLWDGRPYCKPCLRSVCPQLIDWCKGHVTLEETVSADALRLRHFLLHPFNLVLIVGFLTAGLLGAILSGLRFLDGGWCCLALPTLMLSSTLIVTGLKFYVIPRTHLPRTIAVRKGKLVMTSQKDEWKVPLSECVWQPGSTRLDKVTFSHQPIPAVILTHHEHGVVACGLTPESYRLWAGFLTLAGLYCRRPFPFAPLFGGSLLGLIAGVLVGWAVGALVAAVTGDRNWVTALVLLGGLDGLILPFAVMSWVWHLRGTTQPKEWRYGGPLLFALKFGMLGVLLVGVRGVQMGLVAAVTAGVLNGCLGWFAGRFVVRRAWPVNDPVSRNGPETRR